MSTYNVLGVESLDMPEDLNQKTPTHPVQIKSI